MTFRFIIIYLLIASAYFYIHFYNFTPAKLKEPLINFPQQIAGWKSISESHFDDSTNNLLKASDYLFRTYRNKNGNAITVYIGYHNGNKESGVIHSPKQCLPGSGWQLVSSSQKTLSLGHDINLVQAIYQKHNNFELFYYWFHVKEKTVSSEYLLKMYGAYYSVLNGRRDTAFVRISTSYETDLPSATTDTEEFIKYFFLELQRFLPL